MSTNPQEQEIDLGQLTKKIGSFFQSLVDSIFDFILFLKRNIIILGILFILGIVLGYISDKKTNEYDHEVVVIPNFGSVDYLYSKIKLINSKRKEGDTLFLKSIGIKEPGKLGPIEVEPIMDVYKFIQDKESNFDLIRLMAEDGDIDKIIENETTAKNYPYHLIKIKTKNASKREDFLDPILNYFENSDYFSKIRSEVASNLKIEILSNEQTLVQINDILNDIPKQSGKSTSVYISENNQLNEVIKSKEQLVNKQSSNRIALLNFEKTIKEISVTLNIKDIKGTNGKLKFVYPLLFVFLFLVIAAFRNFYKKQLAKRNLA
ncbi:hypothetical protein [uncultured Flavobacterium sp.]|uniref:hypothetical protein n=1 Tax=uncultured Flavobacterium sp. TaxID=165435 RepID=UPI0030EE0BE6|tara:strand:+ start:24678 stop:25637 length:960 start_codon:yes stop_codon:yes gene_type:complete